MKKKLSEVFVLNDDEKVKPISDFLEKEIEIDLKDFRPADRFNEISKERDEYKQKLEERGKELDQLKQNAGDNTALKKQIEEMQETNKKQLEELTNQSKQKETEWETKLKTETKRNKIMQEIITQGLTPHDMGLLMSQIDVNKVEINDNGMIGLKDQLENIKTTKGFLFKSTQLGGNEPPKDVHKPNTGDSGVISLAQFRSLSQIERAKYMTEHPDALKQWTTEN